MTDLANKYRPTNFSEVRGNSSLKSIILRSLKKEDKPQCYILQGTRGCGKTTLARIMAEKLGAKGRDLKELNIASLRGIDTARSIEELVSYMPMDGGSKVIVLNEVHKATNEFFNAMLEILEEPPPNVYFILCTTEPHKVLPTIMSRCALRKFYVKPLKRREMQELVEEVLSEEDMEWKEKHIKQLVKMSEGIPREALILLDSLITLSGKRLTKAMDEIVRASDDLPIDLIRAINNKESWATIKVILKGLGEDIDVEQIRWKILKYMRKVLLDKPNAQTAFTIECFEDSFAESGLAGLYLACYKALNL